MQHEHNTMSHHAHTLADIADAMREHDQYEAPGSESAQRQAFVDESRHAYMADPFDDEASETIVLASFAAYWLAVAVPDTWMPEPPVIDLGIFADSMGETDEAEALASEYDEYLENEIKREYPNADVFVTYVPNHAGAARHNVFADTLADEELVHHFIDQYWPRFLENRFCIDEYPYCL